MHEKLQREFEALMLSSSREIYFCFWKLGWADHVTYQSLRQPEAQFPSLWGLVYFYPLLYEYSSLGFRLNSWDIFSPLWWVLNTKSIFTRLPHFLSMWWIGEWWLSESSLIAFLFYMILEMYSTWSVFLQDHEIVKF